MFQIKQIFYKARSTVQFKWNLEHLKVEIKLAIANKNYIRQHEMALQEKACQAPSLDELIKEGGKPACVLAILIHLNNSSAHSTAIQNKPIKNNLKMCTWDESSW